MRARRLAGVLSLVFIVGIAGQAALGAIITSGSCSHHCSGDGPWTVGERFYVGQTAGSLGTVLWGHHTSFCSSSAGCIEMEYCDLSRATVTMEVAGLTSDLHDQIICGDEMDFALSIIRVAFDDAYAPDRGDAWALFVPAVDCAIPASLAEAIFELPENCHLDPATGMMTYAPEPSTWALILLGLTALKAKRRHRRL